MTIAEELMQEELEAHDFGDIELCDARISNLKSAIKEINSLEHRKAELEKDICLAMALSESMLEELTDERAIKKYLIQSFKQSKQKLEEENSSQALRLDALIAKLTDCNDKRRKAEFREMLDTAIVAHIGSGIGITIRRDESEIGITHLDSFFREYHWGQMSESSEVKPKMEEILQFEIKGYEKYTMPQLEYPAPKKFHQTLNDKYQKRGARR